MKNQTELRYWAMGGDDPHGQPFGIVDEEAGGIVAYAVSFEAAEQLVATLNGEQS